MAAGGKEDLFGADSLLTTIVEDDFNFILGEKVGTTVDIFDFVILEVFLVDAVQPSDVSVTFVLERCEVEGSDLFDAEAVCFGFLQCLCDGSGVPGDLFGDTASTSQPLTPGPVQSLYPTLTQVPPRRLLSTAIVFTPHCPLARRAHARPPLPPPTTRKSHSLLMGAMPAAETENCREILESLESTVVALNRPEEWRIVEKDSLSAIEIDRSIMTAAPAGIVQYKGKQERSVCEEIKQHSEYSATESSEVACKLTSAKDEIDLTD